MIMITTNKYESVDTNNSTDGSNSDEGLIQWDLFT